ncbi:exosortase A [Oxalobacteraceae bacterium]|nr:exosortase A [Oxalobacteraceae bacterium]
MSADSAVQLQSATAAPASVAAPQALHLLLLVLGATLLLHYQTAWSMLSLWLHSQTFAHGLAVLPISAWLIWRRRATLASLPCEPAPRALALLAALGAAWLVAAIANVQILQQYLLCLMVPAIVVVLWGAGLTRAIAFALAYLLLAVPFGEVFIPALVEFTASFTVTALQLSGIPVLRENNYLTLPSGQWSVVDACSGLRYVIASLALGILYAYLNYRSLWRRLAFIAIALVLPVVANGLRAYGIILIGHVSDMRLAVGIDHLVYGWVFFGLVSLLLFWCGSWWQQPPAPLPAAASAQAPARPVDAGQLRRLALACVALVACWPVLAAWLLRAPRPLPLPAPRLTLAAPPLPWRTSPLLAQDWKVLHRGLPQKIALRYTDGSHSVSLQLFWYRQQSKGAELLTPVRRPLLAAGPNWQDISSSKRAIVVNGRTLPLRQTVVQAAHTSLLTWRWYRVNGRNTASPQLLKLLHAKSILLGGADDAAEISLAASFEGQPEQAADAMRHLLADLLPIIEKGVDDVAGR